MVCVFSVPQRGTCPERKVFLAPSPPSRCLSRSLSLSLLSVGAKRGRSSSFPRRRRRRHTPAGRPPSLQRSHAPSRPASVPLKTNAPPFRGPSSFFAFAAPAPHTPLPLVPLRLSQLGFALTSQRRRTTMKIGEYDQNGRDGEGEMKMRQKMAESIVMCPVRRRPHVVITIGRMA